MRKLTALLAAGLVLGLSGQAMATNQGTATVGATIISPIEITTGPVLSFGKFVLPTGTETVTMPTSGSRTKSGGLKFVSGGTETPAVFTVTGSTTLAYNAVVGFTNLLVANGVATGLKLTSVDVSCGGHGNGSGSAYTNVTDGGSLACTENVTDTLTIGGTLEIDGTAATAGIKTSVNVITVTVDYN